MAHLTGRLVERALTLLLKPSGRHRSVPRPPLSLECATMVLPRVQEPVPDRYAHIDELRRMPPSERAYWVAVMDASASAATRRPL